LITGIAYNLYRQLTYLTSGSPKEVNVSYIAKQGINKELASPTPSLFDEAQKQVFDLIKMDSYIKWKKTDSYQVAKGTEKLHFAHLIF
jgi:regulator of G-protein signaling